MSARRLETRKVAEQPKEPNNQTKWVKRGGGTAQKKKVVRDRRLSGRCMPQMDLQGASVFQVASLLKETTDRYEVAGQCPWRGAIWHFGSRTVDESGKLMSCLYCYSYYYYSSFQFHFLTYSQAYMYIYVCVWWRQLVMLAGPGETKDSRRQQSREAEPMGRIGN